MVLATQRLTHRLFGQKEVISSLFLCQLLGTQNLLYLGVLSLRLGLAVLDKSRELVLVRLLAELAIIHFGMND